MRPLLCDMHVHSGNSHDSICAVTESAKACAGKNIAMFAVTDHCDIQFYKERNIRERIGDSVREAELAAEQFRESVTVLKGVEIGEGLWNAAYTKEIAESYPYDVILGSVHAVCEWDLTEPYSGIDFSKIEQEGILRYLELYLEEVFQTVRTVPCDVLAHLTCPLRYINGKYHRNVEIMRYRAQIERIFRYMIDHNIALELNTSGIGTPYGAFMPDEKLLRMYRQMGGGLITLGSDAHTADRVGNGFVEAVELLKRCGFGAYYYYRKREAVPCRL